MGLSYKTQVQYYYYKKSPSVFDEYHMIDIKERKLITAKIKTTKDLQINDTKNMLHYRLQERIR